MSNYVRKLQRKRNKQTKKSNNKDKVSLQTIMLSITLSICLLVVLGMIFIPLSYLGFNSWDSLDNFGYVELNLDEKEYYYDVGEYCNLRYERAQETLGAMLNSGLLAKKYYDYLIKGTNHSYFENVCIIDYETYQKEADDFIDICNRLENIGYDSEPEECDSDCIFKEYMESYVNSDYREKLGTAHENYHRAVAAQAAIYELSEEEIQYYYEVDLVTNTDNIESIEVELTYLTAKNIKMSDTWLNWYTRSTEAALIRDNKILTTADKDALNYLSLVKDAGLFDESVANKVIDVLYMIGDELENKGSDSMTVIDITGIDDYASYINDKIAAQNNGINVKETQRFLGVSISDRYAGEQVYVLFNIKNCKHKDNLPDVEEYCTDEWKTKLIHNLVVDSFWSSMTSDEEQ